MLDKVLYHITCVQSFSWNKPSIFHAFIFIKPHRHVDIFWWYLSMLNCQLHQIQCAQIHSLTTKCMGYNCYSSGLITCYKKDQMQVLFDWRFDTTCYSCVSRYLKDNQPYRSQSVSYRYKEVAKKNIQFCTPTHFIHWRANESC